VYITILDAAVPGLSLDSTLQLLGARQASLNAADVSLVPADATFSHASHVLERDPEKCGDRERHRRPTQVMAIVPNHGHGRRMLMQTPRTGHAAPPPSCDDCRLPATFRTEVCQVQSGTRSRVYQCANCAKVIWLD
jgi:hypothetical protein